jgi:hypothetical protein
MCFTFKAAQGDLKTALNKPNSIVLTKKAVSRYFKTDEDPLGKQLTWLEAGSMEAMK